MKKYPKEIKVYWRKWRQISRICRWMDIDCKMDGTFNGRYVGYKMGGRMLIFRFTGKVVTK